MKVLLIQPRPSDVIGYKKTIATEPLGLEIVAAALKEHDVQLVDTLFNRDISGAVLKYQPDAAGISCSFTVDVYQTLKIAGQIKAVKDDTFVFVGGHHASLSCEDFYHPAIDAVVVGEGETTAPELLRTLEEKGDLNQVSGLVLNTETGQHFTGERALLKSLDNVPFAQRGLTEKYRRHYYLGTRRPLVAVETSRGCPYQCNFCSIWRFYGGKMRKMHPERVVDELSLLPPADTLITDDNFLADVQRADQIATLIEKRNLPKRRYIMQARSDTINRYPEVVKKWRKIGLDHIFIGFEKIDQEQLDQLNKKNTPENNEKALRFLKSIGVGVYASFIIDPGFTKEQFQKLFNYLKKHKITQPQFSILTPLPGTGLYQDLKSHLTTNNYELFDLFHAVLPTALPLRDFYQEFVNLYKKIYISPESVFNTSKWFLKKALSFQLSLRHLQNLISGSRLTVNPLSYLHPAYDAQMKSQLTGKV